MPEYILNNYAGVMELTSINGRKKDISNSGSQACLHFGIIWKIKKKKKNPTQKTNLGPGTIANNCDLIGMACVLGMEIF